MSSSIDINIEKNNLNLLSNLISEMTPSGRVYSTTQNINQELRQIVNSLEQQEEERRRLAEINNSNTLNNSNSSDSSESTLRLKVFVHGNTIFLTGLSSNTTMERLVEEIRQSMDAAPNFIISRIRVTRTNSAYGHFDGRSIASCDIKDRDYLVCDAHRIENVNNRANANHSNISNSSSSGTYNSGDAGSSPALQALPQAFGPAIPDNCTFIQAIALLLHSIMLESGFVCLEEVPNSVPGFAPAMRDLPKSSFIPVAWTTNNSAITLIYKHSDKRGKHFSLMVVGMDTTALVTLSQKNGDSFNVEYDTETTINQTALEDISTLRDSPITVFKDINNSRNMFSSVIDSLMGRETRSNSGSMTERQNRGMMMHHPPRGPPAPFAPPMRGPGFGPRGMGGPPAIPVVGGNDVFPNFGHPPGGILGPGGDVRHPSGNGSFVGPDHPMFNPNGPPTGPNMGPYTPGFEPGTGLPHPRFDPFGPPGVGMGGGRGMGRGMGRGRGGRWPGQGRNVPGEPDPDHLRPSRGNMDRGDFI